VRMLSVVSGSGGSSGSEQALSSSAAARVKARVTQAQMGLAPGRGKSIPFMAAAVGDIGAQAIASQKGDDDDHHQAQQLELHAPSLRLAEWQTGLWRASLTDECDA
jgi:hypothetical protein